MYMNTLNDTSYKQRKLNEITTVHLLLSASIFTRIELQEHIGQRILKPLTINPGQSIDLLQLKQMRVIIYNYYTLSE